MSESHFVLVFIISCFISLIFFILSLSDGDSFLESVFYSIIGFFFTPFFIVVICVFFIIGKILYRLF